MAKIKLKSFQDFKEMVNLLNLVVLYRFNESRLELYFDRESIYFVSLEIVDADGIPNFLSEHFDSFIEIEEVL